MHHMQSVTSRPSAVELLTVLDFWEWYPYHLRDCRVAVNLIGQHKDQIAIAVDDGDDLRKVIPVTDIIGFSTEPVRDSRLSEYVKSTEWELTLPEPLPKTAFVRGVSSQ